MRRRTLLRRVGTAGALAVGASGVVSADEELYVNWQRPDGRVERVPLAEFERRSDTPALDELDAEASSPPCCGVLDEDGPIFCVEC